MRLLIVLAVLLAVYARNYPLYKQCDAKWANEQLGTSANTICKAGCLMSSASMALAGTGHNYNPSTLNAWLKGHGGYVSGDLFVWGSINSLGLVYQGKAANNQIKTKLDQGFVVICNVHSGAHWVLAHSYSGDDINVNDPGYSTTSYALGTIVEGQSGIYKVGNSYHAIFLSELEHLLKVSRRAMMSDADGGILPQ